MNKKEILLICLILLCLFGAMSAVASADVGSNDTDVDTLTTSEDVDVDVDVVSQSNDLSSYSLPENNNIRGENDGAGSFSDLQDKINSAGGNTVTLDRNYTYNSSSNADLALSRTGVVVNGEYTIEGQANKNITINALGMSKFFSLNGTITLKNINFIRGSSVDDSPVYSNGTLTVENCNFTNGFGLAGGAIHAVGGLNISNSHFISNKATNEGGSIYIGNSSLTSIISNSTFAGDKALDGDGGSISSATSLLTLCNLSFTGCYAGNDGGAILLSGHNTTLNNINISNCRAADYGGAIYFRHNHKRLSNMKFVNNRADYGGAIYCYPECDGIDDGGLENVTFIGNNATVGGAMYVSSDEGKMINATFINNKADYNGGAIFIEGTGWRVYNSTFNINTASRGSGGAIYVNSGTGIIIDYSNFTSNRASSGGAINYYNNSNNASINHSRFISNIANSGDGGAVYLDGDNCTIEQSYFEYNSAISISQDSGFGGAVSLSGSNDSIINSTFKHNNAVLDGGAVVVKNPQGTASTINATIKDTTFEYNVASRNGGSICWSLTCPNGTVINCTFSYNNASGSAGALGIQSDYGHVYNSTFKFNHALGSAPGDNQGNGGAMVFAGNHNYAYNCTYINNTAANHGGASYVKSTAVKNNNDTTFVLSKFINNTATKNGGAIDWSAGSVNGNIFNSTFTNNTALRSGGAVHWSGTYGEIVYSNFTNNKAIGFYNDANGGGDGGAVIWLGSHGVVDHCNFTDNFAQYRGGAVFLEGQSGESSCNDTNFTWSRFINNTAGLNGGAVDWQAGANNGRLIHAVFINNTALRSGGAVYWYGTNGTVEDCNFTNNRAEGTVQKDDRKLFVNVYTTVGGNGGAIVWTGVEGQITLVNFDKNYAASLGGAIYLQGNENVTLTYANFTNNWADINGGAIDWAKGAANGIVEHTTFINNTAKRSGGAIYWYGHNGTLTDVTFINNSALGKGYYINPFGENTTGGDGGAIFWTGYDGNVIKSVFINNTADKRGGAVFLQGTSDYACNNTRFVTALFENNTAGTNGGAVDWFKGATHGLIDNATFNNNIANRSGGAIYWCGNQGYILNSNFTNNTAKGKTWAINAYGVNTTGGSGGAIIWSGSNGVVNNSRFINNTAARHGGAVYMQGTSEENCTNTTFDLCYFEGNNATINGGALDWHENAHGGLVNNSNFTYNRAGSNGGAIYWLGHDGNITHSNFTYNYALGNASDDSGNRGDGGAVIWGGLSGYVDDCWFKFNNASARGGAVYVHNCEHGNNDTHFTNSHFINNTAGTNGGAIDWHAGAEDGAVSNTEFINNTAQVNGGAIYWNGNNGEIINSNFTYNIAHQNGGAVYWEGHNGIINGSIFKYNNATSVLNSSKQEIYHNNNTGIDEVHYDILGGDGGAIIWKGSEATIENTTFYKNYAPYRGGAIFFTNLGAENCENVTIKGANFTLNSAGMNGGALDWAKGARNATILSSYFNNNTAGRSAGAIYVSGNDLDIGDSEFNYNKITGETEYDNRTGVSNYTSIGGNGGAICWMGSYGTVDNVTFLNNTATQRGGAIQFERNKNGTIKSSRFINNSAGTEGGAIDFYNGAENGKIIDTNFTSNTAQENGGAIYWQGHYGIINGARFDNNRVIGLGDGVLIDTTTNTNTGEEEKRYNITGGDGGAIKWTGSHGLIENTTFYKNTATYNGGALYLIGNSTENCTNITFIDCNFTENLAKLNGGAVYWAKGASNASVSSSHFINNTAKRSAGAIYISGNYLDVGDTEFKYNDAAGTQTYDNRTGSSFFSSVGGNAGAICWMGSFGTVDNGTFINNTARQRGGAIQFERNENGTVKNSYFENNSAYGDGGAIDWYQGAVNGQLLNSTFVSNYVLTDTGRGSGVYIEGFNATIKDSRFYKHNAITDGGAVYIEGDDASVENTTFENINTTKNGGAIFVYGDNATITDSNFTDVHSVMNGGAIFIEGEYTAISGSKFNNTYSKNKGGAIYVEGGNVSIIGSDFINSTSENDGGALYVIGEDCKLHNSTFENNSAEDDGGAIYWQGNRGELYNITCVNNSATGYTTHHSKGGTICLTANDTSVGKAKITDSFVAYNGGAMFITGNNVNITDSDFKSCRVNVTLAPSGDDLPYGGALYVLGENTTVANCTFDNCTAIMGGIVYVEGDNVKVSNATCGNSSATEYGGAFYIDGVNATISASSVENTNASLSGGAIYIHGIDATIDNSSFDKTNAFGSTGNGGGAIFIEGNSAVVKNSNFTSTEAANNTHAMGGAMYITGNNVNVTGSNFNNTKANLYGGAVYINGVNTTIMDSNFTKSSVDSSDSKGGAIYVNGINAKIVGSDFEECSAKQNGGSIYIVGANTNITSSNFTKSKIAVTANNARGGAIYVDGRKATIAKSEFVECSASQDGGAIYIKGEFANVINSTFDSSSSKNGAGLYLSGNNATVDGSIFIHGRAGDCGGGIFSDGIGSKVYNSNFTDNKARHTEVQNTGGGAIYWKGGAKDDTIENCNFIANDAGFGGAIRWVNGNTKDASGLIKGCTFESNTGFKGSTISWASANTAHITQCTFIANVAQKNGGIYAGTDTSGGGNGFKISLSNFINNTARCGADIATSITNAIIIDCNFTNSTSGYGGSIVIRERAPKNTQIINCIFTNTSSTGSNDGSRNGGGAIYVAEDLASKNADNIQIINVTIRNSTSNTDGGAIKWGSSSSNDRGAYGKLINVTIINSTATGTWSGLSNSGKGGAIYWLGAYGSFKNVTVVNANSKLDGGAVYFEGVSGSIVESHFINCVANETGGAIYWNGANGVVNNTNFTNNSAKSGGAIYWNGANGIVDDSLFTSNHAINGGAIYWTGSNGLVEGSKFIKNNATNGGAVYWATSGSTFTDNELYNNTADCGGAVYWAANGGSIDNSTMIYNKAINGSAIYIINPVTIANTVLLENQAHSFEIYNRVTSIIERVDKTINIFTYLRGGDNLLNAIYNTANVQTVSFRNVTYYGINGRRNTNEVGVTVNPLIPATGYPENDGKIYQSNLEIYQNITVYAYDGDNDIKMNMTDRTNYNGSVSFSYTDPNFRADKLNVKVFHLEDNYYTYIAFANNTKLPQVILEVEDIYFKETEYLNITVRPLNATEMDPICPGNVTLYLNGEIYIENVTLTADGRIGKATIPISKLHVGKYNVFVAYSGNQYYIPEYNYTSFNVMKINSTINVHVDNYYYGETGKVIIQTIDEAPANVTVILNGKEYTIEVNDTGYAELGIPLLDADNYTVEAYYPNTRDCYPSSNSTNFTIYKVNSTINITGEYLDINHAVKLYFNVGPADTVGKISIMFNNKQYNVTLTNSTAELTIYDVVKDTYPVYAEYYGDRNHHGSKNTTTIEAYRFSSYVRIDATNITYGENETIIFTLPANVTGNLTISFNGETFNRTIVKGKVVLENLKLAAGTYPINATYKGNNDYYGSFNKTYFIVAKAIPVLEPVVENITYMDIEHITANINQTGNVSIIIRDLINPQRIVAQNLTINITNGKNVTWNLSGLARGEYIAQFIFSGNQNFTSLEKNATFSVDWATPIIIVQINSTYVGNKAPINITVYPRENVTGNVTVYLDGIKLGDFNLTDGFVRLPDAIMSINGTHDVVAVYNGDGNFTHAHNSTTCEAYRHDVLFNVTGLNVTVFDNEIIHVNLPQNATGMVYIRVNDTQYYLNLTEGRDLNIGKLKYGTYVVYANYTGDNYWNGAVNTTKFKISKVDSSINVTIENITVGDKLIINITTTDGICGNVTVNVNGTNHTAYVSGGHGLLVLDNMPVGEYPVNVTFNGCAKYLPNSNTTKFTVSKVNATSDIKIIDKGNGTVVVVLPGNATGEVNITVGNQTFNATVVNGTAVVNLENVTPGVNNITVVYSGDANHTNITVKGTATIPKLASPISVDVHNIRVGDTEVIVVSLPVNATGTVTIEINGQTYTNSTIVKGKATFRVSDLVYGNKTVAVKYLGDANYTGNFTTANFTVNKRNSQVNVTVNATTVVNDVIINVTIPANATGYVIVSVDGQNYTVNTTNGNGTLVIKGLGNITHSVNVTYIGDEQYFESSNSTTFNVSKIDSFVSASADNITLGDKAVIRITVPQNATGNVTAVIVNGETYYVPVSNGTGLLVVPGLKVGNYTVQVTYNGDGTYVRSTQNQTKFSVNKINATSEMKVIDQGNGTVVVVLPGNATGEVNVTVGNRTFNATVVNGTAVITLENVTPGVNNITVVYSGDGNYTNMTVNSTVVIPKLASPITVDVHNIRVGDTEVIVVSLPVNATGSVTIEINGQKYTNSTMVNGNATFRVADLAYGNKTVAVVYSGDANYTRNCTTANFTVNKRNSQVNVTVTATTVVNDVVINVTVPANATGYVIVNVDGQNYTVNTTNGNGTLVISGLGNITHSVNVTYIGDEQYFASSNSTTFNVSKIDSFVSVSVDNITLGDKAVIRITVPQNATGNVTAVIVNGETYYVPVSNGTGLLVVPGLKVGNYTVQVTYNGDDTYVRSTQNQTKFSVNKINATSEMKVIDQGNGTVVVVLPGNATGEVNITVGNKTFNATVANGTAVITLENVTPGVNNITVVYSGDGNYTNMTVKSAVVIPKLASPITVDVHNIYVADTEVIVVSLPVNATGSVTIEINGQTYTNSTIVNGNATFTIQNLAYGNKTVAVVYSGDANYTRNSTTANFTVNKRSSKVNVTATASVVGMDTIINVTIPSNATGYVIVNVNATSYTVNTTNGNGSLTIRNLGNGKYTVNVTYIGDDQYLSSTNDTEFTILRIQPTFAVNGTDITYGDKELIKFESVENITAPVKVEINGRNYTAFIIEGKGNLTVDKLAAGKYNVTVYFDGNCKYLNASANNTFNVARAVLPVWVIPQNITFTEEEIFTIYMNATAGKVDIFLTDAVTHDPVATYYGVKIINNEYELPGYLEAGNYTVLVQYRGDANYTVSNASANFTVTKKDPTISIEVQNITYGDVERIIVHVNAEGNVTIKVNGTTKVIVLNDKWDDNDIVILRAGIVSIKPYDGKAREYLYNLNAGEYPVEVTFNGNENYNKLTARTVFFVNKDNTTADVSVNNIAVGGKEIINVTISNVNVTGNVTINVDGVNYTRPLVNGTANITFINLSAGNHSVVVIYEGDNNFRGNWTSAIFNVTKVKPELTIDVNDTSAGKTAKIVVNLPDNATGFVVIDVDGTKYHVDIVPGQETALEVGNLLNKTYNVSASYSGDEYWQDASNSTKFNVNITKANISVKAENITVGDRAVINITTPKELYGNVTVNVDGKNYTVYVAGGNGILVVPELGVGNYTVNVTFDGNDKFAPNNTTTTLTVSKVNVTADEIKVIDQGNGTVVVVVPNNATGNVTIYVDGKNFTSEVINGTAVITMENVTPGVQNITAVYNGDSTHSNSTVNATVTVPKYDTPISVNVTEVIAGETAVVTVTVPENATGNVTVTVDGKQYSAEAINGTATIKVDNITAGNKTIIVEYAGDGNYTGNYTVSNFTVERANVTPELVVVDHGNGTVVVVVGDNATGEVTIKVGDKEFNATVVNGTAVVDVGNLTPGDNKVEVIYSGDSTHGNATVNTTITGPKYESPITVNVTEVKEGEPVVVTVTVPDNATGEVTVYIDGQEHTVKVENGTATVTVDNLTAGPKTVTVEYSGDGNYTANYTVSNFTVGKANVTPELVVVDHGNGTVVVVVGDNATGNVTIKVGDKEFNATVVNGTAVVDVGNLTPGDNKVEVIYSGDSTHTNSTVNTTITGPKYESPITVNVSEVKEGEPVVVTVFVPGNASGNVTVYVGGQEYPAEVIGGIATVTVDNLTAGPKTVTVEYSGDGNYTANYTVSNFTVGKANVTPELVVVDHGNGTVVVVVGDNATGNVTIKVGDKEFNATVVNGTAVVEVGNLTPGDNKVEVIYSGDSTHGNATVNTTLEGPKYEAPITVNVSEVKEGEPVVVTVTVPDNATGEVTVYIDGQEHFADVIDGIATVIVDNLTAGPKTITVEYSGDGNYTGNYTVSNFTVEKVNVTPELVVVDHGNGTVVVVVGDNATGEVTIKVGDKEFNATVVNGTAVVEVGNLTPGTNKVEVIYSGDSTHTNSTVNTTITGPKYESSITVNVSEVKEGEPVVVTVTVPDNATGEVTVYIDGQEHTVKVENGTATIVVDNLTAGPKTITVEYSGDGNYSANYTVSNFTVGKDNVTPELVVVDHGNGTVVVVVGDNATGEVTIKVGDKEYNATVVNGTAVVEVGNLTPGTNNVEVIYSGDSTHGNATVNTTLEGPKYETPITVNVGDVKEGEPVVVTVNVPDNATGDVTVYIDGQEHTVKVVNGTATVVVDNLTAGPKTITVEYSGDGNYTGNYTVSNFTVEKAKETPEIYVVDQGNGTVVVVVPDNATGDVTIKVGNNTVTAHVINGTAIVQLDNLTPGDNEIEVIYSGDSTHTNATVTTKVTGPKYEAPINVTAAVTGAGEKAVIVVSVPENATGTVTIEVDGKKYTTEIVDGNATFEISDLTVGNKTIAVEYSGDGNYTGAHTTANMTVSKVKSSVSAIITDINVGDNVTVTVFVPKDATGQVLIDIDGVGYYVNVTDGTGTVQIPRIPSGIYPVNITYVGDDKYLPSNNVGIFDVNKVPSYVVPTAKNITVGENEIIVFAVPVDATGNITVIINGESFTFDLDEILGVPIYSNGQFNVAVSGGKGVLVIPGLQKGQYEVSVTYNGDDKYLNSSNKTVFNVAQSDCEVDVVDLGNGTVKVFVSDNATGDVTVKVGNQTYNAEIHDGIAVINLDNLSSGTHDIEVIYSGDENHKGKTVESKVDVPKKSTPIGVSVHNILVGDTERVVVTVPEGASGVVSIEINSIQYNATISNGEAVFDVKGLTAGSKTVAVTYWGDSNYVENFTTAQFEVSKRSSTITASSKDIVAGKDEVIPVTVPKDATGKVTVKINGVEYAGEIVNGKVKVIIPNLPAGNYNAVVTYEGDDKYMPSSTTISFKVIKASTPISANGSNIEVGEDATVTVKLPSDATGTVTITIEGKKYVADVVDGKAVFYIPGLTKGNYSVIVYYSGDGKYDANETVVTISVAGGETPHKNETKHESEPVHSDGIPLSAYETGNPIFVLLLILLAIGSTQIRILRK